MCVRVGLLATHCTLCLYGLYVRSISLFSVGVSCVCAYDGEVKEVPGGGEFLSSQSDPHRTRLAAVDWCRIDPSTHTGRTLSRQSGKDVRKSPFYDIPLHSVLLVDSTFALTQSVCWLNTLWTDSLRVGGSNPAISANMLTAAATHWCDVKCFGLPKGTAVRSFSSIFLVSLKVLDATIIFRSLSDVEEKHLPRGGRSAYFFLSKSASSC